MTHSFDEICKLDSERTQGEFVLEQWPMAEPKPAGILTRDKQLICEFCSRTKMIDAQYIAAMPDAVGLLKEFKADNTKLQQLLDRAIMGLEYTRTLAMNHKETELAASVSRRQDAITSFETIYSEAQQTLADIRKQLGDTNG
jgi:hypothetical protein